MLGRGRCTGRIFVIWGWISVISIGYERLSPETSKRRGAHKTWVVPRLRAA